MIGHDAFSKNIGEYFTKYAWKNAELKDFLREISKDNDKNNNPAYDIVKFNEDWIEKAGPNSLELSWDPS